MFELLAQTARYHALVASAISLALLIVRRKTWPVLTRDRRFWILFIAFEIVTVMWGITEQMTLGVPGGARSFWTACLQTFLACYLWSSFPREYRYSILHPTRWKRRREMK